MYAKIFIILVIFVCVTFAFDAARIGNDGIIETNPIQAVDNLNATNLISYAKGDRPCKGIPGCFQFMCNKCCGDCNSGDCVTAMCMLCCG